MKSSNSRVLRGIEYWEPVVKRYRESGLSQAEFCRQNDIGPNSLSSWNSKINTMNKNKLVQLPLKSSKDNRYIIFEFNQIKASIPLSATEQEIRNFINAIKEC